MATSTIIYSANTAITLDVSSLAGSATWVAGVESAEIDNTTNKYVDALVDIKGITWSSTTNTVGQEARVYVWGSDVSLGTTPIDQLDGTSSAETITVECLQALRLAASASALATTGSLVYWFQPFSVRSLFGGVMPKFWGLFFVHSMTGAVHTGQSGKFQFTGIKYDMT
jgi:hypothetical protein